MGRAKDWMMEQDERGWYSVGDHLICDSCVREVALAKGN
jgi:hypothetical protein